MKKVGLLHGELGHEIASLGHTQTIVIGDAGLPVPDGVMVIDLAVTRGIPSFMDVVRAVLNEGVFEAAVIAQEIAQKNPAVHAALSEALGDIAATCVTHEQFKVLTRQARCIVRTGETSPYANVILVGGVNF